MFRRMLSRCRSAGFHALLLVCMLWCSPAWSELAQEPLLSRTVNVRPNILLSLDTSDSMASPCLMAQHVVDKACPTTVRYVLKWVPTPGTRFGGGLGYLRSFPITEPDLENPRWSSPANNLLSYTPYRTFWPGFLEGVQLANASVGPDATVFFYLPRTDDYLKPEKINNPANYIRYDITATGFAVDGVASSNNPFGAHGGKRTDCAGTVCTLSEERQNIANWRAFHMTRLTAMRAGLSAAFARQPDSFRLAWTTTHAKPGAPIKNFGLAKADFFKWLDQLAPSGGSPLRSGLNLAGQYYSDSSNTGPWGSTPWAPAKGETSASHLSCRRAHTLLVSDNYWDDTSLVVGDLDGSPGPLMKSANGLTQYTYKPGAADDSRSVGKSDRADGKQGTYSTLADVAMKYWVSDLRPDLPNGAGSSWQSAGLPFWQNMTTHVVSFGARGAMTDIQVQEAKKGLVDWPAPVAGTASTVDDMMHAVHNSGGQFLTLTDADQFSREIGKLLGTLTSQKLSQAGVAASSPEVSLGVKVIRPFYTSGNWWGNLELVELDSESKDKRILWRVIDVDTVNGPTGKTLLPAPENRNIVVWVDDKKGAVAFNHANLTASSNGLMGTNANVQMNASVSKEAIDFLRGDRSQEGTRFRSRLAVLGDIVNAQPVYVKNVFSDPQYERLPAGSPGLSSYAAYIARKNARTEGVIFVGANDGMLHVFNEGSGSDASDGGRELFAYVPRSVLGKLNKLTSPGYRDQHIFTVDGPLVETDVYMGHGTAQAGWRNLVLGTTGAGAKAVFALDATEPLAMTGPSVLWEINPDPQFPTVAGNKATAFQELGYVLSAVQSGVTASGHWVSVFGNGYDSKSGRASLFIVDSGTGALLREIKTDSLNGNGLGAPGLVRNANRQIIGVYAGDLQGRLWKFDLSGSPSDWALANQGNPLFRATETGAATGTPLPITWAPVATERADPAFPSSHMVSFATGKLTEKDDLFTTKPLQAAFGLWDRQPFGSPVGEGGTDTQQIADSQLEWVNLVDKTSQVKKPKPNTNYYGATYANATTKSIDWTSKRGWRLILDDPKTPGLRAGASVTATGDVVMFNLVAPPAVDVSCDATEAKAAILSFDPINGLCRVGGSLDTDGDGVIDEKDDPSVCGLSLPSAGPVIMLRVPKRSGDGRQFVDVRGGVGSVRWLVGNDIPARGVMSRSWRQIFPRGR